MTHFVVLVPVCLVSRILLKKEGSYMEDFFCRVTSSLIGSNVGQDHVGTERERRKKWRLEPRLRL